MTTNKRITDLTDYTSVLPYASELFGVYQPMIGWRSRRQLSRYQDSAADNKDGLLRRLAANYSGDASKVHLTLDDCTAEIGGIEIGRPQGPALISDSSSQLLTALAATLPVSPPKDDEWDDLINTDVVGHVLNTQVARYYIDQFVGNCRGNHPRARSSQMASLVAIETASIKYKSALAGALLDLVKGKNYPQLRRLFYVDPVVDPAQANSDIVRILGEDDPFATFDPKRDIASVSLSPLEIVHLFRQFFFELDSFLGTPTGHVWLSPGSTVELIEISTRRTYTEKIIEQSMETTQKTEDSSTDQDELSEAVKSDNKNDLKLGASLTVNQSWGTGNATATGSMNLDTTRTTLAR